MVLLKTILIILLVYYGLKIVARLFAPRILSYAARKTESHFKEKFGGGFEQYTSPQQEQQDIIKQKTKTRKANPQKKVGDYIDFEEID